MFLPLKKELDEAFRSDRSIWVKLAGCAFVGLIAGILGVSHLDAKDRTTTAIVFALLAPTIVGAAAGVCLSLKDVVTRRQRNGERVSPVLRALFGWGIVSLVIWFAAVFVGVFIFLMIKSGG